MALTTVQFLPVSLLSPIAADLHISEGAAGQTVTAPSLVALATSLVVAVVARNLNRRTLLLWLAALLGVSNVCVAMAPNLPLILIARMLMGVGVGAFWAFAPALVMRLVPSASVSRALSIIFGGVAISTIAASPLASYLGTLIGWRGVFVGAACLSLLALVWQAVALPSLPSRSQASFATLVGSLRRPPVQIGLVAAILSFGGHFAFYTYVRTFLEGVTHLSVTDLSAVLLVFGIAGFVGTTLSGPLLKWNLTLTIAAMALLMSLLAAGLVWFGQVAVVTTVLLALWGFAYNVIPVAWNVWLTRIFAEDAESGGGLLVATAQLAITAGAAVGGLAVDGSGPLGAVVLGGILLLLAAIVVVVGVRAEAPVSRVATELVTGGPDALPSSFHK